MVLLVHLSIKRFEKWFKRKGIMSLDEYLEMWGATKGCHDPYCWLTRKSKRQAVEMTCHEHARIVV